MLTSAKLRSGLLDLGLQLARGSDDEDEDEDEEDDDEAEELERDAIEDDDDIVDMFVLGLSLELSAGDSPGAAYVVLGIINRSQEKSRSFEVGV